MNTAGPSGPGHALKRKQIIDNVITKENSDLILVQEFRWTKVWPGDHFEPYVFFGHEEAKIFFNVNKFEATLVDGSRLRQILEDPSNNFPSDFTPLPRMCICRVKPKGVPLVEFICVSWHGRYKTKARIIEFQHLLRFLKLFCMKEGLPLLLGGDFNLNINDIQQYIVPPFKVHDYNPLDRRIGNIIDFYITRELEIGPPYPVDIKTIIPDAYNVLDHDPISCILTLPVLHQPLITLIPSTQAALSAMQPVQSQMLPWPTVLMSQQPPVQTPPSPQQPLFRPPPLPELYRPLFKDVIIVILEFFICLIKLIFLTHNYINTNSKTYGWMTYTSKFF